MKELRFEDDILVDRFNEGLEEEVEEFDDYHKEDFDYEIDALNSIGII